MSNPKDGQQLSERDAETLIHEAFRRAGKFLPQSPDEVEAAEAEFDEEQVELPLCLRNPFAILDCRTEQGVVLKLPPRPDCSAVNDMACAARHGSNLTPEVLAQMDADEVRLGGGRGAGNARE